MGSPEMLELEPTRPQADEVVTVSTRRCSWADSRRRHPFVFAPFVVVRLSPVPAGIARPGVAGLTRSRLPLGRAGTVAGTNPTDKTNTNGYPYPSCVPIVDSEEPDF